MVSAHTFIKQFMEIKILIFFILILILGLSLEIQMDWSTLIKKVWKQKLSSKCENFKDFIQNNLIDLGYILVITLHGIIKRKRMVQFFLH